MGSGPRAVVRNVAGSVSPLACPPPTPCRRRRPRPTAEKHHLRIAASNKSGTGNRRLIRAAAEHGIALVLGPGRRLLDDPLLVRTYRPEAGERPPLPANLGRHRSAASAGPSAPSGLVELLGADGLSIHLNPLQEAGRGRAFLVAAQADHATAAVGTVVEQLRIAAWAAGAASAAALSGEHLGCLGSSPPEEKTR